MEGDRDELTVLRDQVHLRIQTYIDNSHPDIPDAWGEFLRRDILDIRIALLDITDEEERQRMKEEIETKEQEIRTKE